MSKPMMRSKPAIAGGARGADDAARRAGQDRVLALEAAGLGQAAVGLHEVQPRAGQLAGDLIDVAAQDRRQIGIHHRGVAARHEAQQRADGVAGRDLGEACLAREVRQALLVLRDTSRRASARWRRRAMPSARAGGQGGAGGGLVERFDLARRRRATRPPISATRSYSIVGSVIARSNRRGRAWLPMRSMSAKPRLTSSRVRSPLRSSSALVATVVPIFTASIGRAGSARRARGRGTVLMPAMAASR